jgi:capsule polysaccharide export protein KpsE/RkpR
MRRTDLLSSVPYLDDSAERDSWRAPRGKPADPGRLWQSVKWDWRWIPIAALIWGVLGAGVAFGLIENTYRSSAALVWEPKSELRPDERTMMAEIASIKGPGAMGRARQLLELPISLAALSRQVDFQFEPHSRFVVLNTEGATPADAVKLGRVMVRVFLELQHGFNQQRALTAVAERDKDLADAKQKLDEARKAYDEFRANTGEAGEAGAGGSSAALSAMSPEAAEQFTKVERLRAELNRARAISPEDPRIPALTAQIAALEAHMAKLTGQRTGSPATGATAKDPAAKPDKHSAIWRVLGESSASTGTRPGAHAGNDVMAEEARRRSAEVADAAAGLQKKIEEEQQHVAVAERALARARAESNGDANDWRVLTPPGKPSRPERAMQGLVAVAMPLTGMLVALLALLLRPLVDGRVYTAREASYWGRLPVLASTAWPRTREMFFPLVDELGQQATGAPGCTLVVGASAAETKLAEELASWLDEGLISSHRRRPDSGSPASASGPAPVKPAERVIAVERKEAVAGVYTSGVHAWLGDVDGPALRRAARVVDRVIVLMSSGALTFSAVAELRTRLGRSSGVALVVLGLNPTLLKLPDQSGEVGRFWRYVRRASRR